MKKLMATAAFCLASGTAHAQEIRIHTDVLLYDGENHQLVSQETYSTIAECQSSNTRQNLISADPQSPSSAWQLREIQSTFTRGVAGRPIRPPHVPDHVKLESPSQLTDIEKINSVQCTYTEQTKTVGEAWTSMLAAFKR